MPSQTERLAAPVSWLAHAALDKRWKKVGKRARGFDRLDVDGRHELRKELKKLRYAMERRRDGQGDLRRQRRAPSR